MMRWNALAMVVRANRRTASSAATSRATRARPTCSRSASTTSSARRRPDGGDLVFFQPHSAPGVYARAFLEGRLSEERPRALSPGDRARGTARAACSLPASVADARLLAVPDRLDGLGPIIAIYQARFMRYLQHRGLLRHGGPRRVWGVVGDGEMDEPESLAALSLAAREGLDNLILVVNCNLQRLDGPVRGNGRIIQELEALFAGAGWNVIKLLWGCDWDPLFARDHDGMRCARASHETVDGEFQTYARQGRRASTASTSSTSTRSCSELVAHLSRRARSTGCAAAATTW